LIGGSFEISTGKTITSVFLHKFPTFFKIVLSSPAHWREWDRSFKRLIKDHFLDDVILNGKPLLKRPDVPKVPVLITDPSDLPPLPTNKTGPARNTRSQSSQATEPGSQNETDVLALIRQYSRAPQTPEERMDAINAKQKHDYLFLINAISNLEKRFYRLYGGNLH
jgi:hypothetical protein